GLRHDEDPHVVVPWIERLNKESDRAWLISQRESCQLLPVDEGDRDLAAGGGRCGSLRLDIIGIAVEVPHEKHRLELPERHRNTTVDRRVLGRPQIDGTAAGEKIPSESLQ